jgi:uncharacterized protein YihD (DUF1040 family)
MAFSSLVKNPVAKTLLFGSASIVLPVINMATGAAVAVPLAGSFIAAITPLLQSIFTNRVIKNSDKIAENAKLNQSPNELNHSIVKLFSASIFGALEQALSEYKDDKYNSKEVAGMYGAPLISGQDMASTKKAVKQTKGLLEDVYSLEWEETDVMNFVGKIISEESKTKIIKCIKKLLKDNGAEDALIDLIDDKFVRHVISYFREGLKNPNNSDAWIGYQRTILENLPDKDNLNAQTKKIINGLQAPIEEIRNNQFYQTEKIEELINELYAEKGIKLTSDKEIIAKLENIGNVWEKQLCELNKKADKLLENDAKIIAWLKMAKESPNAEIKILSFDCKTLEYEDILPETQRNNYDRNKCEYYVKRKIDERLSELFNSDEQLIVVYGLSTSGKTRAVYQLLKEQTVYHKISIIKGKDNKKAKPENASTEQLEAGEQLLWIDDLQDIDTTETEFYDKLRIALNKNKKLKIIITSTDKKKKADIGNLFNLDLYKNNNNLVEIKPLTKEEFKSYKRELHSRGHYKGNPQSDDYYLTIGSIFVDYPKLINDYQLILNTEIKALGHGIKCLYLWGTKYKNNFDTLLEFLKIKFSRIKESQLESAFEMLQTNNFAYYNSLEGIFEVEDYIVDNVFEYYDNDEAKAVSEILNYIEKLNDSEQKKSEQYGLCAGLLDALHNPNEKFRKRILTDSEYCYNAESWKAYTEPFIDSLGRKLDRKSPYFGALTYYAKDYDYEEQTKKCNYDPETQLQKDCKKAYEIWEYVNKKENGLTDTLTNVLQYLIPKTENNEIYRVKLKEELLVEGKVKDKYQEGNHIEFQKQLLKLLSFEDAKEYYQELINKRDEIFGTVVNTEKVQKEKKGWTCNLMQSLFSRAGSIQRMNEVIKIIKNDWPEDKEQDLFFDILTYKCWDDLIKYHYDGNSLDKLVDFIIKIPASRDKKIPLINRIFYTYQVETKDDYNRLKQLWQQQIGDLCDNQTLLLMLKRRKNFADNLARMGEFQEKVKPYHYAVNRNVLNALLETAESSFYNKKTNKKEVNNEQTKDNIEKECTQLFTDYGYLDKGKTLLNVTDNYTQGILYRLYGKLGEFGKIEDGLREHKPKDDTKEVRADKTLSPLIEFAENYSQAYSLLFDGDKCPDCMTRKERKSLQENPYVVSLMFLQGKFSETRPDEIEKAKEFLQELITNKKYTNLFKYGANILNVLAMNKHIFKYEELKAVMDNNNEIAEDFDLERHLFFAKLYRSEPQLSKEQKMNTIVETIEKIQDYDEYQKAEMLDKAPIECLLQIIKAGKLEVSKEICVLCLKKVKTFDDVHTVLTNYQNEDRKYTNEMLKILLEKLQNISEKQIAQEEKFKIQDFLWDNLNDWFQAAQSSQQRKDSLNRYVSRYCQRITEKQMKEEDLTSTYNFNWAIAYATSTTEKREEMLSDNPLYIMPNLKTIYCKVQGLSKEILVLSLKQIRSFDKLKDAFTEYKATETKTDKRNYRSKILWMFFDCINDKTITYTDRQNMKNFLWETLNDWYRISLEIKLSDGIKGYLHRYCLNKSNRYRKEIRNAANNKTQLLSKHINNAEYLFNWFIAYAISTPEDKQKIGKNYIVPDLKRIEKKVKDLPRDFFGNIIKEYQYENQ